jgi:hypothetical protein
VAEARRNDLVSTSHEFSSLRDLQAKIEGGQDQK